MNAEISLIPKHPSQVAKAIVYILMVAAGIYQGANGHVTLPVILAMIVAVVGVIPVYLLAGTWVKTGVTFIVAGVQALILVIGTSLTTDLWSLPLTAWVPVLLTAFAAIGVAIVPNKPMIDAGTAAPGTPSTITNVPPAS